MPSNATHRRAPIAQSATGSSNPQTSRHTPLVHTRPPWQLSQLWPEMTPPIIEQFSPSATNPSGPQKVPPRHSGNDDGAHEHFSPEVHPCWPGGALGSHVMLTLPHSGCSGGG